MEVPKGCGSQRDKRAAAVKAEPEPQNAAKRRRVTWTPLLDQLSYGKVLKTIAQLNHFTPEESKAKSEQMKLARIVVIGDESAGKSSTLERIAMSAVLPRSAGICTRMPVVLKLRHDPAIEKDIYVQLPGAELQKMEGGEKEARDLVDDTMRTIEGIEADKEIIVEIRSKDVPTLDLVDLPGLIAARADGTEPPTISAQTAACTQKYLDDPRTGVVVCVIPAGIDNLRSSRALGLVLNSCRKDLIPHTLGVFAKADKAKDSDWEDEEQAGPMWRLEDRLRGSAEDSVELPNGYVAIKNRNSRSKVDVSIEECCENEYSWFLGKSEMTRAFLDEELLLGGRLGLTNLIKRIDKVFCKQLASNWLPGELAAIKRKEDSLQAELAALGTDPCELSSVTICTRANELINSAPSLSAHAVHSLLDDTVATLPAGITRSLASMSNEEQDAAPGVTMVHFVRQKATLKREFEAGLDGVFSNTRDSLVDRVRSAIVGAEEQDLDDNLRLARFPNLCSGYGRLLRSKVESAKAAFSDAAMQSIELFFSSPLFMFDTRDRGLKAACEKLRLAISEQLMRHVLDPLFSDGVGADLHIHCATFGHSDDRIPADYLEEQCSAQRQEITAKLRAAEKNREALRDLHEEQETSGAIAGCTWMTNALEASRRFF